MIYFIGGASRSGKSIIAKCLANQLKIPYLSTDSLMMGFMNGVPEMGIHDKLWPDQIAIKMWPFIRSMCENMIFNHQDYIIEGEALLPNYIKLFVEANPSNVKSCFIGYGSVNIDRKVLEVKRHPNHENDWLVSMHDNSIYEHITNMRVYSQKIKQDCFENGIKYFESSSNFEELMNCVIEFVKADKVTFSGY